MPSKVILVTGANGFVGKALVRALCLSGYAVRATVRSETARAVMGSYRDKLQLHNLTLFNLGELNDQTDWSEVLDHVDTVIHCAARAHVLCETSSNPLETFRQINTHVTQNLARQASDKRIRRFIFLSSIGVLGLNSLTTPFTDESEPNPQVPYAQAKWEAEQSLHAIRGTMDKVIIRPPIVYGSGVKGNFGKLLTFINKNIPIPLGAVKNKRQFIGIDNLVDFIITCIEPQMAINETFLIADKEVISTTQLLQNLARLMKKRIILLPVPHKLMEWGLKSIGMSKLAGQLLGNLEIKSDKAKTLLNWEPPYTMDTIFKEKN